MSPHLEALLPQLIARFRANPDLRALALTGSLARGLTWIGSDIDFWGFYNPPPDEDFEDGFEDGHYWEIDKLPLDWLTLPPEGADIMWQTPPSLYHKGGEITPLEALWGCRVLYDADGRLTAAAQTVAGLMADRDWLAGRAHYFLTYGRAYLDKLDTTDPIQAICTVREIATCYGVGAYWMQRGALLSSLGRVPERLADSPAIQATYRAIYGLNGEAEARALIAALDRLPEPPRTTVQEEFDLEVRKLFNLECFDGGVHYLRSWAAGELDPALIPEVLGITPDPRAQLERVRAAAYDLLKMCAEG